MLLVILLTGILSPGIIVAKAQNIYTADYEIRSVTRSGQFEQLTKSGVLTGDDTWSGNILVNDTVIVPQGVTLTIEPGTVIKFKYDRDYKTFDKAGLEIQGGSIKAVGTNDNMIWFTSAADDPINGDWWGISVYNSQNSEFKIRISLNLAKWVYNNSIRK